MAARTAKRRAFVTRPGVRSWRAAAKRWPVLLRVPPRLKDVGHRCKLATSFNAPAPSSRAPVRTGGRFTAKGVASGTGRPPVPCGPVVASAEDWRIRRLRRTVATIASIIQRRSSGILQPHVHPAQRASGRPPWPGRETRGNAEACQEGAARNVPVGQRCLRRPALAKHEAAQARSAALLLDLRFTAPERCSRWPALLRTTMQAVALSRLRPRSWAKAAARRARQPRRNRMPAVEADASAAYDPRRKLPTRITSWPIRSRRMVGSRYAIGVSPSPLARAQRSISLVCAFLTATFSVQTAERRSIHPTASQQTLRA